MSAVEVGRKPVASATTEPQESSVAVLDTDLGRTPQQTPRGKTAWIPRFHRLDCFSADLVWHYRSLPSTVCSRDVHALTRMFITCTASISWFFL